MPVFELCPPSLTNVFDGLDIVLELPLASVAVTDVSALFPEPPPVGFIVPLLIVVVNSVFENWLVSSGLFVPSPSIVFTHA